MNIDIYKSASIPNAFLFVPLGCQIETLPSKVQGKLGGLIFFKSIVLISDSPLIAADPNKVLANIIEHGYHVQGAKIDTDVSEAGAALGAGILAASLGAGPLGAILGAAFAYILVHKAGGDENDS